MSVAGGITLIGNRGSAGVTFFATRTQGKIE